MSNDFFTESGAPTDLSRGSSATVRSEFITVRQGFDKLPTVAKLYGGNASYAVATGTADAIVVALNAGITSYADGLEVVFRASGANTQTTSTINVNALGAKTITRADGTALAVGDIAAGQLVSLRYDNVVGKFQYATNALGAVATVAASAAAAAASEATASTKASEAGASAIGAAGSESTAMTKASEADASAIAAAASEAAAAASYDSFDDRYLGAKASEPTVDNDGNALITGALYFNTTTNYTYVRTAGGTWQLMTQVAGVSSLNGQTGDLTLTGGTVTDFASSGTYTVPSNATFVEVHAYGAGGGGGSGRRGAAASLRTGGGGGGGGACVTRRFKVSEITSTVAVTIGAGGAGGAARTTDSTAGLVGSVGGNSTFGSYVTAYGGGGGSGGNTAADSGGGGGGVASAGSGATGGSPLITAAAGTTQQFGGGGGATGVGKNSVYGGGGGGHEDTTNGAAGYSMYGGGGGAGGAGISTSNNLIVTVDAGGPNNAVSANTTFQYAITGADGAAYTGGQGGGSVVINTSSSFTKIAYGNSKFLALANNFAGSSFFSTSANGTTGWDIAQVACGSFAPTSVFYDGSKWIFYNSTAIYTTTDLVNFSAATATGITIQDIAFAGGLYVAVGNSGAIKTSTDLVTWTTRTSGTAVQLNAVTHNGTKWIAVGNTGVTLTSTDAITWALVTVSGTPNFSSVASNGANLVAHSGTTPFANYSTDTGATWAAVATTMAAPSGNGNKTLIYAGGRFVLISGSVLYTSTDGNTWTLQTDGTTDNYSGLAHNGTTYVVGSGTLNGNIGITATDAVTWTARTFTDGRTVASGAGGAGGIAAGGGGGAASLNGTNSGAGAAGGNGFIRVFSW